MSCEYSPAPWPCIACGTLGGPGLGPIMLCTEPGEGPGPGLGPRMGPGDRPAPGEGPAWDIPTGGSLGVDIYQLGIWGGNGEKLEPTVHDGFTQTLFGTQNDSVLH